MLTSSRMKPLNQHDKARNDSPLPPFGPFNHHPNGNQPNHALTIILDQSDLAPQNSLLLPEKPLTLYLFNICKELT